MTIKTTIVVGSLLAMTTLAAFPANVSAATRTVCFRLKFIDNRSDCPVASATGARRPCLGPIGTATPINHTTPAVGHVIELWDKDTDTGDDFIGRWTTAYSGTNCATFEWEGASYGAGEANPDVYVVYPFEARDTTTTKKAVFSVKYNGTAASKLSWRNGTASEPDRYVAMNCAAGTSCDILPGKYLVPSTDPTTESALRIMALDSAQHALQVFNSVLTQHVTMRFPDPGWSYAIAQNELTVSADHALSGMTPAHEMGHVIQMQQFEQDDLRNSCGDSHSLTSVESESCATTEGWANYAAAVAWYDPNNTGVTPLTVWGHNIETARPHATTCTGNVGIELQVAKAFWDLDDANNEAAVAPASDSDSLNYSTSHITLGWSQFPDGTGNRQDYEEDANGVNVRDYYANNTSRYSPQSSFLTTLVGHNCLGGQDNN